MQPDSPFAGPLAPFPTPVPVPSSDPFVEPFYTAMWNVEWTPYVLGALLSLVAQATWKTDDPEVLWLAQKRAMSLIASVSSGFPGERPFWETEDDLDNEDLPEAPWYEQISDWIITAFLAVTFTPNAAIVYSSTIPRMRLVFRSGDLAGTVRVLIDGVEVLYESLYSETSGIVERVVQAVPTEGFRGLLGTEPPYLLRIEKADESTETKLEVVLGDIRPEDGSEVQFRQLEHCPLEFSNDGGETWTEIYTAEDCVEDGIQAAIDSDRVATPSDIEALGRAVPPENIPPSYGYLCAGIKAVVDKVEDYLDAVLAAIDLSKETMAIISDIAALTIVGDVAVNDILALIADSTAATTAAIRAAKGANGLDDLKSALYCLAKEAGGFFETVFDDWRAQDVGTNLWKIAMIEASKTVSWAEWALVYAVAATNEDNSCEAGYDCGWCFLFDFTADDGDFVEATGYQALWSTGNGWAGDDASNMDRVFIARTFDSTLIASIEMGISQAISDPYGVYICPGVVDVSCSGLTHSTGQTVFSTEVNDTVTSMSMGLERGGEDTSAWGYIEYVKIMGFGTCPFGEPNC